MSKNHSLLNEIESNLNISLPSTLQEIEWPIHIDETNIDYANIWLKRDDLIHPIISGNKWRKLSPILTHAVQKKWAHLASFGGGYSNHLHALAYTCYKLNIKCTAIIRGDYTQNTTPMIDDLLRWHTQIVYVTKTEYRRKEEHEYLDALKRKLDVNLIIPEGGTSQHTLSGVANIIEEMHAQTKGHKQISDIVLPIGSGGTMAGLIQALTPSHTSDPKPVQLHGISVLKAEGYHQGLIESLLPPTEPHHSLHNNWHVYDDFHHGGYAKTSESLINFSHHFTQHTGIKLDKVYNAKSFYALNQLLKGRAFKDNSKICILHTGGIQGNRKK